MADRADPADITIGELGELRVWIDGEQVPLRGARTKSVLAMLALRGARGASMDALVDIIWPDQPPSARRSLANVVRRLRALFGTDAIVTDGATYRLANHVSSHRSFLLDAVERVSTQSIDADEIMTLADAVSDLWRDEPWAGFDADSPMIGDRVVLRDARLRLTEVAARAAQTVGDLDAATRYLQFLVRERPQQERWWCELASVVAASGDRVRGLRLLQTARAALDQVGLSPSAELLEVEGRLLGVRANQPSGEPNRPSDRLGAPSLRVAEDVLFVGRDLELARLIEHAESAAVPSTGVSIVEGPAGAGKSRLIVEAARQCQGHVVLSGRCEEASWSTLGPFHQILQELLAVTSTDEAAQDLDGFESLLAEYLPTLGIENAAALPARPVEEQRERLVRACVEVLVRAAARRPLLLLIDDLQWATEVVLDIVEELAHRAAPHRLAMMATCRFDRQEGAANARVTRLLALPTCAHLILGPLSIDDVRTIAASTDHTGDIDALHRRSGGNAFFITELLRTGSNSVDDVALSRVVRSRVDLVHPRASDFLTAAALCGVDFDPWLIGDVLSLEVGVTNELIDELTNHQLVLPSEESRTCAFAHGLVAEAMMSSIDSHARRRLHLRIVEVEQQAGSPVELWVEHLLAAGPLVDTQTLARSATEAATRLIHSSQPEAATSLMRRVLDTRLDVRDRVASMTWLAAALKASGEGGNDAILLTASELALEHDLDRELVDIALVYSTGGPWQRNNDEHGKRLLALALERCPADRPDLLARLQVHITSYTIFSGTLEERSRAADYAVAIARRSGDNQALGDALNAAIVAVSCPVNLGKTRALEDEMLRLEEAGLANSAMGNRPAMSTFWAADGQRFRADVAQRQAAIDSSTRREQQALNGLQTVLAILDDRPKDARQLLANQIVDNDVESGNHAWNSVMIEWLEGDVARALPVVRRAYKDFRGAPLRYTLLWLAVEAGDQVVIDELYSTISAIRVARLPELFLGGFGLAGLAMTAAKLEDQALADIVGPELERLSGQMIGVPWSSFPSADFFLAAMATSLGKKALAKSHAADARRVHALMSAPACDQLLDGMG